MDLINLSVIVLVLVAVGWLITLSFLMYRYDTQQRESDLLQKQMESYRQGYQKDQAFFGSNDDTTNILIIN